MTRVPGNDDRAPLTAHRLALLLEPLEIRSKQMRIGAANCKGYERSAFVDIWERFLSPALGVVPTHVVDDVERRSPAECGVGSGSIVEVDERG
jgi:hypothetical protein